MENNATPPPLEEAESSRGAGGKIRRATGPKPRPSPYARPPQTPLAVRGGNGGWLSKFVNPACRLIGAGATRLLPSIFSRSPAIESLDYIHQDHDELKGEAEHEEKDVCDKGSSDVRSLGLDEPQSAIAAPVEDGSKVGLFGAKREDKSISLQNADGLSEIEQLINGKMLSRTEVDRLMQILNSKTVNLHMDEEQDKQADGKGKVQGAALAPECASNLKKEPEVWNNVSKVQNDVGASPIDIAKAYMGRRVSEIGSSSVATATGDDRPLDHFERNLPNTYMASTLHNSSLRWPGSTVPDRCFTPQAQRSSYGLHDFRRTPYSRTVHSMSKSKLIHIGDDDGKKSVETGSPLLKASETAMNRQARPRGNFLDVGYRSVGPIRRPRHKFTVGNQRDVNLPTVSSPFQNRNTESHLGSLPPYRRNVDAGRANSTSKPQWADDRSRSIGIGTPTVPAHTTQMARKILEHLDRSVPSPKEKYAELKLATSSNKPISIDPNSGGNPAIIRDNMEKRGDNPHLPEYRGSLLFKSPTERGPIRIADAVGRRTSVSDADMHSHIPANGINAGNANVVSKLAHTGTATDSGPKGGVKPTPVTEAKAGLPPIAIERPVTPAFSSGNSTGFTFPVSASPSLFPEPPTPSIMPPPALVSNNHLQEDKASTPSFSFGSNRSTSALVFSFPSTSSSSVPVEAGEMIKFSFGSGERRMQFSSMAREKDGVCY